jgi:hypothetical protein
MHAQDDGAGAAGLSEMWDLHWNAKKGAGGFIWAFVDEAIARMDRNGALDPNGVNAPDGVLGPHREKEGSYNAIKEIYSPVKITLNQLPDNFNGAIPVENRYNFSNLNTCKLNWELINFNQPDEKTEGYKVMKRGSATAPNLEPFEKGNIQIPLPADWKNFQGLALTAIDQYGEELYRWVWKIQNNNQLIADLLKSKLTNKATVVEKDSLITVKGGEISVSFSKTNGKIVALANDKSAPISFGDGPVLVSGNAIFTAISQHQDGDNVVVDVQYTGDMKAVKYTMFPSGWLQMDYSYTLNGKYPFAGISFNYPENYVLGAKYLGKGPFRVWKNRLQGVTYNTWEKYNNNTQTGSFPWVFPEFKGYYSNVTWIQMNTVEGKFTIASPQEDLFVRLFDFYGLTGIKPHPDLPLGNISFLDGIPAIGSKLGMRITPKPEMYGPAGDMNVFAGEKKRTLFFFFGLAPSDKANNFVMPKVNILTD